MENIYSEKKNLNKSWSLIRGGGRKRCGWHRLGTIILSKNASSI